MNIAVCDDETFEREEILAYLRRYDPSLPITAFCCAAALLAASKHTFFDIIFLDIEMEAPSGFIAAQQLSAAEMRPCIIFVTKSSAYSVRGYDVAFHYLVKPVPYKKFADVLSRALACSVRKTFSFRYDGVTVVLPLESICYFEAVNYCVCVRTIAKSYYFRATLKEIEPQLRGANFARIHKSYLINLAHVKCVEPDQILMASGVLLPLSRARKRDFAETLHIFLAR